MIAESRGGREDRLLKESYNHIFERGVWMTPPQTFQEALTSSQLKLKAKSANISGLQLADLLGHPVKQWVLRQNDFIQEEPSMFAKELMKMVAEKFNRHLYSEVVEGYGYVLFPGRRK